MMDTYYTKEDNFNNCFKVIGLMRVAVKIAWNLVKYVLKITLLQKQHSRATCLNLNSN